MTATSAKKISGYKIRRRSPTISHLLFADDSLIFCRATMEEVCQLQTILQVYGDVSGQRVNFSKSAAIFSSNTPYEVRHHLCNKLGIKTDSAFTKYLGVPTSWGKSKKNCLNYVVDNVQKKLTQWKKSFLSQAGREILIKTVAMAIPTFTMSCFLFPTGVCQDINKIIRKFWWGQKNDERKLCWVSWNQLSKSKHVGGMGFKDLYCFNLAMLARQAWRLLQNPNALWVRVLKSLYFPNSSFLTARKGSHPSWAWSSILKGRDIVQLGMRWNVGTGQNILIYQDNWVPTLPGFKVNSPSETHSVFSYVCELLDDRGEWDITKLNASFRNQVSWEILKIPIGACEDSLVWHHDKYGNFSVKSAYLLAYNPTPELGMHDTNRSLNTVDWKHLWKLKVPPKVRNFLWRAILNSLPSLDNLVKRGITQEITCPNCHMADETLIHLLFYCPHVEPIWFGSTLGLNPRQLRVNCFSEWWRYINGTAKQMGIPSMVEQCAIICWHIWKARNEQYFEHAVLNPHQILARISAMTQECSFLLHTHLLVSPSRSRDQGKQQQPSWVKPPLGFLKVNVDASYSSQTGSAAFAMVARNFKGEICFGNSWLSVALSPLMAEAAALYKAVQYVESLGTHNVFFESDNQALIAHLLQPDKPLPWEIRSLILSIRQIAHRHSDFLFSYVPRRGNKVADWVAKQSLKKGNVPFFGHIGLPM
ncbi:hypothetical protein SLE2022_301180 [Rubroshorea leprosula]